MLPASAKNTTAAIAENEDVLQGVSISEDSERVYYDGKYFSSLIGYTGQASSDELTELNEELKSRGKEETYSTESIVGKSGLEQYMETILQGTDGSEEIIVNNVGKELETVEDPWLSQNREITSIFRLIMTCRLRYIKFWNRELPAF